MRPDISIGPLLVMEKVLDMLILCVLVCWLQLFLDPLHLILQEHRHGTRISPLNCITYTVPSMEYGITLRPNTCLRCPTPTFHHPSITSPLLLTPSSHLPMHPSRPGMAVSHVPDRFPPLLCYQREQGCSRQPFMCHLDLLLAGVLMSMGG